MSTDSPNKDQKEATSFDLGVLFVHGIGTQQQGRTLLQFGDPLFRWLFRWLGDGTDPGGDNANRAVQMSSTELQPGAPLPARCSLTLELPPMAEEAPVVQRWLLAESWWADVFTPPPFTRLAFWLLTYAPWLALDFARRVFRRAWKEPSAATVVGLVAVFLLLVIGPIVGVLLAVLTLVLLVVYVIPVVGKPIVQRVAGFLTKSLGDSFVLMWSSMNHDAMIERIDRDLALMSESCARIAVVSHSQGAALSHEVLANRKHPRVQLFLTVGSAVRRLAEIRQLRSSGTRWQWAGWLSLVAGTWLAIAVSAGIVLLLGGTIDRWPSWLKGGLLTLEVAGSLALLVVAYLLVWRTFSDERSDLLLEDRGSGLRWVDCFASADPVPNGPILEGRVPTTGPDGTPLVPYTPVVMFNHRLLVTDHVTYPANADQFMTRMARELAATAQLELQVGIQDEAWFEEGEQLRRVRTSWLSTFRALLIGAAAFMIWGVARARPGAPRGNLSSIAVSVREVTPDWVTDLLTLILKPLTGRLKGLGITQNELIGAVVLALTVTGAYFLIGSGWSFWDRRDTDRFFLRQVRLGTLGSTLFAGLALSALAGCCAIGVAYL